METLELAPIIMMLLVIFVVARVFSAIVERFGFPGLIGEIVAGIVIANLALNGDTLLDFLGIVMENPSKGVEGNDLYSILYTFSEIGVIFLLFSVGLETRVKDLLGSGKTAMLVATLGVIVPFILGFTFIELSEGNFRHAMFLGAAMVATSVGITARVIKDMHLMDKKESRIIISAAVIDDVLGMVVLAIVKGMAGSEGGIDALGLIIIILEAVVFVIGMIMVAKYLVPRIVEAWVRSNAGRETPRKAPNALPLALVACFFFAWLAEEIGLAAIIGSFLGGMLFAEYAEESGLSRKFDAITTLFISYFFVMVGLKVDASALGSSKVLFDIVIVLILAVISKYIGCGLGAKIGDKTLGRDSINIVGVGMIPRGEVGIIVASIGLSMIVDNEPALSAELYSVIVVMAVASTIIAPPLLSRAFKKKYYGSEEEQVILE